jgi:hypothetical protein
MIRLAHALRRLGCPPGWKLTRAISEGPEPRVEWHLSRCRDCAAEYQALHALAEKTKAAFPPVGDNKMSRDAREAIGARLRAAVSMHRPRSPRRVPLWGLAPVAAVGVVFVVWGVRHRSLGPRAGVGIEPATLGESRATIRAIGPARFARVQPQPDEIVRVDDGEIELEIAPLHTDERFRVVTEDGEVEVRGTSFKVSVSNHSLAAVHVWRGRVEVRSRGGALAVLEAGDDWVRGATVAAPPPTTPVAPVAAVAPVPGGESPRGGEVARRGPARPALRFNASKRAQVTGAGIKSSRAQTPAPSERSAGRFGIPARAPILKSAALERPPATSRDDRPLAGTASFGHAWSLLREGDAKGAAAEFAEVERVARGRDIEEDALYWRAVAVGRTGDSATARQLFGEFLDRFPASSRAGEAAASSGWLLLEAGETRAARRAFERAARDPSPRVQANAREGLARTQEEDR